MPATITFDEVETSPDQQVSVRVFRSMDDLARLRPIWSAWQLHPNADIDFYQMIYESRGQAAQPYIVVVSRDGRPDAMLVGRIEDGRLDITLGYARLLAPKVRMLNVVYGGVLGNPSPENSRLLVDEVSKALLQGEAEAACFRYLKTDLPLYEMVTQCKRSLQRDHCVSPQVHRGMTLPDNVEALRARFSTKVRKNHRWQANKLVQDHDGKVRVECFRDPSDLDRLFRDVEDIAKRTYQRGLGVGFEDSREMRERLHFEACRGTLLANVLYVNDQPVAFWIGSSYKATFFSSFMGYDPGLARYSPGMYLVLRVIDGFCTADSSIRFIDFGLGDAAYKSLLGDCEWMEASVHVFAPNARGAALNILRTPTLRLERFAKEKLAKANFLARVKHSWRQRSIKKDNQRESN